MKPEIKIVKLLLGSKEGKFTIKKLAETLNINYRIAHEKVMQLEKEGLIRTTKVGNARICEFVGKFTSRVFEAEYERRSNLCKNRDFLVLHKRLSELQFPFVALLFGSHVKGAAGRQSDIDILTIGGNEKEIRAALSLWPEKIHLTSIAYKDFIHMAKSREFSVVSEAIKKNIILIGIEEYYRLLENAQ